MKIKLKHLLKNGNILIYRGFRRNFLALSQSQMHPKTTRKTVKTEKNI